MGLLEGERELLDELSLGETSEYIHSTGWAGTRLIASMSRSAAKPAGPWKSNSTDFLARVFYLSGKPREHLGDLKIARARGRPAARRAAENRAVARIA